MGLFAVIIQALSHVSTLISGIFIGQQTGANKKPEESIANSTIGSENRHNYDSFFNITFEDGNTGTIVIIGLLVFIAIVILVFFLYCCLCCQCRSRRSNEYLNQDVRQLFELMSTTKREYERKQEHRENQEFSNIENSYETIKKIRKSSILKMVMRQSNTQNTQIPKTETKDKTKKLTKKHDNKHPYQSKLENIYGSTLLYMM